MKVEDVFSLIAVDISAAAIFRRIGIPFVHSKIFMPKLLDWKNIDFTAKLITVTPAIAKRRSVRHVDITDNLAAWLLPQRKDSGPVAFPQAEWRWKFDRVRKAANLSKWPANGLRHSFASYHLAQHNDQNKTALLLGHRSTDVLFNHYRGLVTADDAARFWSIRPCTTAVSMMPVSAAS